MKTTIEIPRPLWKAARMMALEQEKDLRTIVLEALEAYIGKPRKRGSR